MKINKLVKKISTCVVSLLLGIQLFAQNPTTPITNIRFTPQVNVPQPMQGMIYYHLGRNKLVFYNGSSWDTLNTSGTGTAFSTSAQLAALISDETGTGEVVYSTSPVFNTGIIIGSNQITATQAGYLDFTSSGQAQLTALETEINDTILGRTVLQQLSDTSLYFSWTIGLENPGDTALFSTGDVIASALWDGSHNLVITKVVAVNNEASKDIDIAILHDVNYKDATPTEVLNSDLTVTSNTTGNSITSFNSATIEPLQWLWIRIDQAAVQPTQCIINIYGYKTVVE